MERFFLGEWKHKNPKKQKKRKSYVFLDLPSVRHLDFCDLGIFQVYFFFGSYWV